MTRAESGDLVSVIIPAHNAEATLDETLRSVRAQSYTNFEVVVIDDGSIDKTRLIALRHAEDDSRVTVASTPNRGVACARNLGIRLSRGQLIAPVDADDLWHPDKIKHQVAALARGGPRMGYVYSLFRRIDMESRVIRDASVAHCEGAVFLTSLVADFVGNGSALLIRRAALEEIGGYEPDLRRRGVEGAEDRLVQILIARRWSVGAVPLFLIGYRDTPDSMSADEVRMLRSQLAVLELVANRHPKTPGEALDAARAIMEARLAMALLRQARPVPAAAAIMRSLSHSAPLCLSLLSRGLSRLVGSSLRAACIEPFRRPDHRRGSRFLNMSPEDGLRTMPRRPHDRLRRRLAGREAHFCGEAGALPPALSVAEPPFER